MDCGSGMAIIVLTSGTDMKQASNYEALLQLVILVMSKVYQEEKILMRTVAQQVH